MVIFKRYPSDLKKIPEIINEIFLKIKKYINEDDLFNIRISLLEALTNAIKHGNRFNRNLEVEVFLEIKKDKLIIKIHDKGEGFDYKNLKDPTEPDNLSKTSGRGIFLIKNFMDNVRFFDCGRGIEMVKSLKNRRINEDKGGKKG